jgi:hypothetical protein
VSWNKFLLSYIFIIFFLILRDQISFLIFNCRLYEQEVSIKYYFSFFAISNSSEHDSHGCFSLVLISNSFSFWTATFNIGSSSQLTKEKRKRKRSSFLLILKANIPKKKKKKGTLILPKTKKIRTHDEDLTEKHVIICITSTKRAGQIQFQPLL